MTTNGPHHKCTILLYIKALQFDKTIPPLDETSSLPHIRGSYSTNDLSVEKYQTLWPTPIFIR